LGLTHALEDEETPPGWAASPRAYIGEQSLQIVSDWSQLGGIVQTREHHMRLYLRRATVNEFLYGSAARHAECLFPLIACEGVPCETARKP
jgi:hypothetical protein